ncbi:molybdate ABC transporter permease subunit [Clostridium sp. 19966]|uniref:molybdate ABC transporter permease subunit n=1 Tax=Clostridium sp. 19966 TaxID=2768166 RepID=UPI0028E08956|nr:molybdate ABC transporter permease subunit [Clostridium sp. 19966]MDT8717419.1 molybdate ABC transporter permease subunit [Clostridium sp. 19966]
MNFDYSPLWISIKTSVCATIITFIIGILAAKFLSNKFNKFASILDALFTIPMVLPPTVAGFILLIIFGKNGPLGKILFSLGIQVVFSWSATVIAAVVVSFPIMYKTAKAAFEQIDSNVINVARTLGVTEARIFRTIIMPLTLPGILAGTILSFARALGEFGATLMLAGSIPGKTSTIPIAIYFAVEGGDIKTAIYWVAILLVISLIVIISSNYWSNHERKFTTFGGKI